MKKHKDIPEAPQTHYVAPQPTQPINTVNATPAPITTPTGQNNGQIWCSGSSAPGWNVSTNKCEVPVNAITPEAYGLEKPQYLKLSDLPNTGDNSVDVGINLFLGIAILTLLVSWIKIAAWIQR